MGSLSKLINDIDGANEDEQAQKERLQMLLSLAKAKIQQFREKLDAGFANPGLVDKTQIPGTRSIRYIEQYHVASKSEFNTQVGDHLDHAIDAFFSIGEGNNKDAVKSGLKQLIQTGLSAFIGSTEVGETQDQMYFVVPENNAFVRVDVVAWKYYFEQHKILAQSDTAVAYVLCKSVIDHKQITLDELIYLVTQALSSGEFVNTGAGDDKYKLDDGLTKAAGVLDALGCSDAAVIDFIKKAEHWKTKGSVLLLTSAAAGNPDTRPTIAWSGFVSRLLSGDRPTIETSGSGETAISKLRFLGQIDGASASIRSKPASLGVVEGYIDELVRVWKKLDVER